jgi:polygalacturonase
VCVCPRYVVITTIDNRPNMIWMEQCSNVLIQQMRFINSPMYHLYLNDMANVTVRNIDIHVDVENQKQLLQSAGYLTPEGIPMFPLNTDGIDPSGINFLIENVTITNYDDAVAVKPNNGGSKMSNCTQNITVRNVNVCLL